MLDFFSLVKENEFLIKNNVHVIEHNSTCMNKEPNNLLKLHKLFMVW